MRNLLAALLIVAVMATAGEPVAPKSVDDQVADRLEQELKGIPAELERHTITLRRLQLENNNPREIMRFQQTVDGIKKRMAEKQALLAKLRPTDKAEIIRRAEEKVKAAEDALAQAKKELELAKGGGK